MLFAAAAAKPHSLTLCDTTDGSLPGSPVPGILQARTLEWVSISFSNAWKWKVKVKLLSRVQLLATPWTADYQAPLSMGFSRQEYWSGVPLSSPWCSLVIAFWIWYIIKFFYKILRFFFKIYIFLMERWLLYWILLFSVKSQHESAKDIHISPPFWTPLPPPSASHPSRLIQSSCLSFLSHITNSHWLSILHI